jgi:hypothetical protein
VVIIANADPALSTSCKCHCLPDGGWVGGCVIRIREALEAVIQSAVEKGQRYYFTAKDFRKKGDSLACELWLNSFEEDARADLTVTFPIDATLPSDVLTEVELLSKVFGHLMRCWGWNEGDFGGMASRAGHDRPVPCNAALDLDTLRTCLAGLDAAVARHAVGLDAIVSVGRGLFTWIHEYVPTWVQYYDEFSGMVVDPTNYPMESPEYWPWGLVHEWAKQRTIVFRRQVLRGAWGFNERDVFLRERLLLIANALYEAVDVGLVREGSALPRGIHRSYLKALDDGVREVANHTGTVAAIIEANDQEMRWEADLASFRMAAVATSDSLPALGIAAPDRSGKGIGDSTQKRVGLNPIRPKKPGRGDGKKTAQVKAFVVTDEALGMKNVAIAKKFKCSEALVSRHRKPQKDQRQKMINDALADCQGGHRYGRAEYQA